MLRHFFKHFNSLRRWAVHLDGDEFINLKNHTDIKDVALQCVLVIEFLLPLPSSVHPHAAAVTVTNLESCRYIGDPEVTGQAGIALEWVHFGSSGQVSPNFKLNHPTST